MCLAVSCDYAIVIGHKFLGLRQHLLLSAPAIVSLLTTNACIFGSQPVGPYTSVMGTMSYTIPGLKNARNARTFSIRNVRGSSTSLNDLFVRRASSAEGSKNGWERDV